MQQLGASSSLIHLSHHTRTTAATLGAAAGVAGELGGMASVFGAGAARRLALALKLQPKTPTRLRLEVSLQVP